MESADLAQEALMDIVLGLKDNRFESERSFLSWIRVVVEHRVVGAARRMSAAKRGSGREVNLGSHLDLGDPWCERPSQIVGRREEADRLNRAIAALPGPDREVIVARLLLELPWPAVAASTGASLEAVQMRFLRARRRLAGVLKGAEAKMPGPSSGTKRGELHGSSYPRRDRFFPSLVASRSGPRR
jgi:RNA polymerase sigma factor (sigma-70 family)